MMDHRPPARTPQEALDNRLAAFMHTHRTTLQQYFMSCGLFNGHPRTLFHLHHTPGMTQGELASVLGVAAPTLSVSIRRMEAAGLVERRPDERDARRQRLYLTEAGEEMDARCAKGRDFLVDAIYKGFSEEDMACLERLLTRMTENLQTAQTALPDEQQETRCTHEMD